MNFGQAISNLPGQVRNLFGPRIALGILVVFSVPGSGFDCRQHGQREAGRLDQPGLAAASAGGGCAPASRHRQERLVATPHDLGDRIPGAALLVGPAHGGRRQQLRLQPGLSFQFSQSHEKGPRCFRTVALLLASGRKNAGSASGLFGKPGIRPHDFDYMPMSPMPPMPPMPPPMPPAGASSLADSQTMHSVVSIRDATEAAFCSAVRVTFVGSRIPISIMSP